MCVRACEVRVCGPSTHDGVVVALQALVWPADAGTVAVLVAAALGRAVLPHKAKVTLTHPRRHARPVQTALHALRLALPGHTAGRR